MTQANANRLYENPEINMAEKYANLGKTLLVTLCYTPILPFALFISAAGLFIEY